VAKPGASPASGMSGAGAPRHAGNFMKTCRLTNLMIAKDFPFMKDLQLIRCKSFMIMLLSVTG
jgi:hypothetical protein